MYSWSSCVVRRTIPDDVHFGNENDAADSHSNDYYGKIDARKLESLHANVFPTKDVPPKEAGQGCAKSRTICTVVDSESHAVDRCPECSITDREPVFIVDRLPCLDDTRQKYGGTNICSCELFEM